MIKKIAAITALSALAISPMFAFAQDGEDKGKNDDRKEMNPQGIDKTIVSVGIANNGGVLVRGAKVTNVSSDVITTEAVVNGVTLTWSVDTDGDTSFIESDGDMIAIADIESGDYVSFSGMLTGATSVDADTVRDWSKTSVSDDNGDGHDNGVKVGFWSHFKNMPFINFFAHAKADR